MMNELIGGAFGTLTQRAMPVVLAWATWLYELNNDPAMSKRNLRPRFILEYLNHFHRNSNISSSTFMRHFPIYLMYSTTFKLVLAVD